MTFPSNHEIFSWIGQPALDLPVYAERFEGAEIEIGGESPYLYGKAVGIQFALNRDHTVRAAFLHAEGVEDFAQYPGTLPGGLSFTSSRADVRAALGEPVFNGDAGGVGLMAIEHSFDRFEEGPHYLRFEYLAGNMSIRMVTVGPCDA
jgi:hypothetical protein